jgi:hypothetical protein
MIVEGELVIDVDGTIAGGESGANLVNDVSLELDREVYMKSGVGNDEYQDHGTGPTSGTLSMDSDLTEASADLIRGLYNADESTEALLRDEDGTLTAQVGEVIWSSITAFDASDEDGPVTNNIEAECYQIDLLTA